MPYDDILCSWLLRSALVSLTILLIGSVAVLVWRQPARQVRIIELVLAGCLIAPWLGMIPGYPQLSVPWWHAAAVKQQEVPIRHPEPMTEPVTIEPTMMEPVIPEPMPVPTVDRAMPPLPSTKTIEAPAHTFEIRPWIVGVYLAGVAIGVGWWLVGIVGLARILWTSQPAPSRCRELLAEISRGRGNRVRLLVSRRLSQPFASAWGRAVIVLPENLCGDEQALRWCLAHEWAHVDGHDFRTWLLAGLAKVLFFYQPLLWWLRRQLRLCQDFVADAQAARQGSQIEDYAEFLTARAAAGRLHSALGLSMDCRKSELYRRVIMLLKNESLESRTPRLWTVSVTMAALVLVAVIASVSLVPRAVAEEKAAVGQSKERGGKTKELSKELTVDLGKGIKLEMVLIPAGEFMMSSPDSGKDAVDVEKPQHRVRITKPFYLGKYLVTQEQWEAVMGSNPSKFRDPKNPVEQVSWDDCQKFLKRLNDKVGGGKSQLPTEAQWEYACRAGSKTIYCFGDDEKQLGEYAWYGKNSGGKTHPVGEKKPNAWGLYDMHGNVWEWCQDWWKEGYYAHSPMDDPTGAATGSVRVDRGGSWCHTARFCRSAYCNWNLPGDRFHCLGLRVSRVPAEAVAETRLSSATNQSSVPPAAKPADGVSPASDQSATKEGPKTESTPLRAYPLVAEPNTEEAKAIAEIEKMGGKVFSYEKSPGKPVTCVDLQRTKVNDVRLEHLNRLPQLQSLNLALASVTDAGMIHFEGLTQLQDLNLVVTNITDAGLEHLASLTQLQTLHLGHTQITDAGLEHLKGLTQLRTLNLKQTQITDAGLEHLRGLTRLQTLMLGQTQVTNAGLANLKGLTQLQSLDLRETKVTDAGLANLKGLSQLRSLDLHGANVTDAGLTNLHDLTNLQSLDLERTQVTDAGLASLRRLVQLHDLKLGETKLADAGVANLNGLSELQSLDLRNTQVTDAGLANLKGLTELHDLNLSGAKVTDAGLEYLKGLTQLSSLNLTGAGITDAGLANLKELTQLHDLNLSRAKLIDAGLANLKGLTQLSSLNLTETGITDAGLANLKGLTKLHNLTLRKTKVTDTGLEQLKGLTQLQYLDLAITEVSDAGLADLKGLSNLQWLNLLQTRVTSAGLRNLKLFTKLEVLILGGTQVTDAGLQQLKDLPKLRSLDLGIPQLTDTGLESVKGLTQINYLSLTGSKVTDAGLLNLKGLTKLQSLYLTQTKITDAGLKHLKGLILLNNLDLTGTPVTDAGLANLKGLTNLLSLVLRQTQVTDVGLEHLRGLTQLTGLYLEGTPVTDAGVKKLQQALPHCTIVRTNSLDERDSTSTTLSQTGTAGPLPGASRRPANSVRGRASDVSIRPYR